MKSLSTIAVLMLGLLLTGVSLTASSARAQALPDLFSQGNAAFFQGDYATAIARYQALVDVGVDDADVHYNLGTAYARAGQCGQAIAAFERSLKASAGDGAAQANLQACQAQLGKRRAQRDGEATVQTRPPWADAVLRGVSIDVLAWIVLVLNALLFGGLIVRRWVQRDIVRTGLAVTVSLLALALGVAALALAVKAEWFREGRAAIVVREDAPLREGPDPRAKTRAQGLEGEPARIVQREGNFVRVRLLRGPEGWMQSADVGAI